MSNLKEIYRNFKEGKTAIETIDSDMASELSESDRSDTGRYLYEHSDHEFVAFYGTGSSEGYATKTFSSEALAVGYLEGADVEQLDLVEGILKETLANKGEAVFEDVEDALLSPASSIDGTSAEKGDSLKITGPNRAQEIKSEFAMNNGVYDPVHSVYIDPLINDKETGQPLADPRITIYDVDVEDIEECMAWGTKYLDEVPEKINVVNGSPEICSIRVSGIDDPTVDRLISTIASDGRWCNAIGLDNDGLDHFHQVIEMNDRIENMVEQAADEPETVAEQATADPWRDGMVNQVLGQMDAIEGNGIVGEPDANSVLNDMFRNAVGDWMTESARGVLEEYRNADDSGREAMSKMFFALTGETFDLYLQDASEACKETLEPYQEERGESLDEMMDAKTSEAEIGQDMDECVEDVEQERE